MITFIITLNFHLLTIFHYQLIKLTGVWIKSVYTTTLQEYKEVLNQWFKGTGGGSGLMSMFETWSSEKLDKYDIDPTIYDHSEVSSRPSILMDGYSRKKKYLTVIFMWDEKVDYILSSKYDPLDKGTGEAGLRDDGDTSLSELSTPSKTSKTSRRRSNHPTNPTDSIASMVKEVITAVMLKDEPKPKKKKSKKKGQLKMEDQSLQDLMQLIEKHQQYLKFLSDNDMLTDDRKTTIIAEIERVWSVINGSSNKRSRDEDSGSCNSSVS